MSFKIYHLSDLNEDAQEFLKMPKRPYKEKDSYNWPNPGEKLQIELISESNRSLKFFLDIYESRKSSSIVVGVINRRSRVRIAQEAPKTQGRWLAVYLFC